MEFPAIIKILVAFCGILVLNRSGVSLGLALAAGALAVDLWAGSGVVNVVRHLAAALARPELWLLLAIVALILELARFMAVDRNANAIMAAAHHWGGRHGRAAAVMAIPAVIGLVPMPGGALFSAPMVAQTMREGDWAPGWKAAVNYWFRHVWEYWWPLYPVVIVTLSIFTVETWQYMAVMIPFSLLAMASGYVFLVRPHRKELAGGAGGEPPDRRRLRAVGLPLILIVGAALLLPTPIASAAPGLRPAVCKMMALLVGMVAGLIPVLIDSRAHGDGRPFSTLPTKKSAMALGTLAGVMVFQAMLEASGLLPTAGDELAAAGIPPALVVALLPFVAGLVTGIAIGFAGTAFPLIVGLTHIESTGLTPLATLALAFGFGYAGMMLSPVHLCFVLTRDYFASSYRDIYRRIAPCVAVLLLAAGVAFFLLGAG